MLDPSQPAIPTLTHNGAQRCMTIPFFSVNLGNVCTTVIRNNRPRLQVMHVEIRKYRQATDTTRKPGPATPNVHDGQKRPAGKPAWRTARHRREKSAGDCHARQEATDARVPNSGKGNPKRDNSSAGLLLLSIHSTQSRHCKLLASARKRGGVVFQSPLISKRSC